MFACATYPTKIFPGLKYPLRVERRLDGAHHARAAPCSATRYVALPCAHAMLAGAGALHADRALGQALEESLDRLPSPGIGKIDHGLSVEVAVAGMADDRRDQAQRLDVGLRLQEALGQARDRNADVGGEGPRGPARRS